MKGERLTALLSPAYGAALAFIDWQIDGPFLPFRRWWVATPAELRNRETCPLAKNQDAWIVIVR